MDKTFKEILNDIKCGNIASPVFTDDDLAKVKLCLPEPISPPTQDFNITVPDVESCVNDGVNQAKAILITQLKKQPLVIEASLVKSKIEELIDHYEVISKFYQKRVDFFTSTISATEPFTAQYVYWGEELTRLEAEEASIYSTNINKPGISTLLSTAMPYVKALSDEIILKLSAGTALLAGQINIASGLISGITSSDFYKKYIASRVARINAYNNREQAKNSATNALSQNIKSIEVLGLATAVKLLITNECAKFSGQLVPEFEELEKSNSFGFATPARTISFGIRLIDLDFTNTTLPSINSDGSATQVEKKLPIKNNPLLKGKPFDKTQGVFTFSVDSTSNSSTVRNYDYVPGSLYNKQPNGYAGFYRKLAHPIQNLFTPEERGLSVDPNKIDPQIKDIQNAPVSIKENGLTLYITSQAQYEKFYDTLGKNLPIKIKKEREEVFPAQIKSTITALETIATREVADFFRRTSGAAIKLARPVSYKAGISSVYTQGEFKYSKLDTVVSSKLAYYTKALDEILAKIKECKSEIVSLNEIIKVNSMDPDVLGKKISEIGCFAESAKVKSLNPECEAATMAKLGKDPLYLRTLSGTDASLPDMNNPCYWREFTKSLNKISILPIPDLTSLIFRYYPINNIIPTPLGIIMIPIPQKWINLFSLSTPLGTIVTFLTIPVAIVGIPLPSVYIFYFAPDGRKYLLLAPNLPMVYMPNANKYGFEVDDSPLSQNPLGINPVDPFKGQLAKGALSLPVTLSAKASKAARVAMVAAKVALGEPIPILNGIGSELLAVDPTTYLSKYLSMDERISNAADFDPAKDFQKQITEFRRNINRQFDRLGEMQITAISRLKDKTRNTRDDQVKSAEGESNLKKKREAKKLARSLDPVSLNDKVSSVLSDFEKYIDKIKLGTIKFPDDPTKLNPKLPSAITGLLPTIEQASKGGLLKDKDSKNFLAKLRRIAASIDPANLKIKKSFNLNKDSDVKEFKKAIKEYANEALEYLQGNKSVADNIDPNLSEAQKAEIARAAELRKKRLKTALAFTSLTVSVPTLKLFDPAAPCCAKTEDVSESLVSPQILAAIAVFNALLDAFLNGLTIDTLKQLLGTSLSNIGLSSISSLFDSILSAFPPITLPEKPDLVSISKAIMIPVLTALHIPQAPNPLGIPFPVQISIPLDAIIKPLLKSAVAYLLELILRMLSDAGSMLLAKPGKNNSTQVEDIINSIPCGESQTATVSTNQSSNYVNITLPGGIKIKLPKIPMIPLDLIGYFALLTSTDLVELIRGLILAAIDGILQPLSNIITPILSLTKTLKDLTFNILEAGNPFILPIKLAIMAIQLQVPNSIKLRLANLDAINALKLAYLPVMTAAEPALKEVNYLAAIIACAFASKPGVQIARVAASPFVNQDDLPPWERLTHKNPLFAIFLDEIAWRGSLVSTGSLIFKTKMPGLYPTSWVPNVIIDPGIHIG